MSATLLANELASLVSEAKRKHADLRNAADKSLQDLKSLTVTSEQQLAADLSRRPAFIDPFLIACGTKNARFASAGIICLQKLVISKGLPKSRLKDTLEAFNACWELGLDLQLKILQVLPSLFQNYTAELEGELLSSALQVCSSLQGAKASAVNGVAAATLQQLITTVFEKASVEDKDTSPADPVAEAATVSGHVPNRSATHDACRVFRDLALTAEERNPKFVQFSSLSPESSLALIWSCINSNSELFNTHRELLDIVGTNIFPLIIRALSERLSFSMTVRSLRILDLILERYLTRLSADCETALSLCIHSLEPDSSPLWKRALVMEVLRNFFTTNGRFVDAYSLFDEQKDGKPIIQDIMASFVRLATEKPAAIGLGITSSSLAGFSQQKDAMTDQVALEAAGGMAGVFSSALNVSEANVSGISAQWSLPKTPYTEHVDKHEPSMIPETYLYALVLDCLNGLSDTLAKIALPLFVNPDKAKLKPSARRKSTSEQNDTTAIESRAARSNSSELRAVPPNPLEAKDAPYANRIKTVAGIVDSCWPAFLASSTTFFNAGLDDQYFRSLIKAHQRFAQVAGLLRLVTPRDALMTALAKVSIPPQTFSAAMQEHSKPTSSDSPRDVPPTPKRLLSIDHFVSQASSLSFDKERRPSPDPSKPTLTTRNLLCLRALLNLAIALGPTLDSAFAVVVNALRQADMALSTATPQQITRQSSLTSLKGSDSPSAVQAFSAEVVAVEAAASRLLESTVDYPDAAFVNVLQIFCRLLHRKAEDASSPRSPSTPDIPSSPQMPATPSRTFSGLQSLGVQSRNYQFVIPKLGTLAELNISRFTSKDSSSSGWDVVVEELLAIAPSNTAHKDARRSATAALVKLAAETVAHVMKEPPELRMVIQRRALVTLLRVVDDIYLEEGQLTSTDLEVQGHVLDALRAILERCGESLVAGWNRMVAIISCAFQQEGSTARGPADEETHIDWNQVSTEFVSPQIGRAAFVATQLLCSDFMESLPTSVVPSLIELLHRFTSQVEDLNISLTTVTIVWNVSDFLFNTFGESELTALVDEVRESDDLDQDIQSRTRNSRPAQWLLVLIRLRDMTNQPLREVRKAVYQTACNIFKSHGNQFPSAAWDLLLRTTILRIAANDSQLYLLDDQTNGDETSNGVESDVEISKVIMSGNADLFSQYMNVIQHVARLPSLWEVFLGILERYLDIENYDLAAASFSALAKVISHIDPSSSVWKGPIYRTVSLWLKRFPEDAREEEKPTKSNQHAFLAYVEAGKEIYPLIRDTMSVSQTRTMIDNLYHCIRESDGPANGADASSMSPLQSKVLNLLKNIRSAQPMVQTCLLTAAAKLAILHHTATDGTPKNNKPVFVAISSESFDWLQELVRANLDNPELIDSDSIVLATTTARRVIEEKYMFRMKYKELPIWRRATTTAVTLCRTLLERVGLAHIDKDIRSAVWSDFAGIVCAVVQAKGLQMVEDKAVIFEDESFDVSSFTSLRLVLIPRLGSADLPPELRRTYARSLFEASIVHATEGGDIPVDVLSSPLQGLETIRRGRVKSVPPSLREDMAYACLRELIALSAKTDDSIKHRHLAQAAAPYLILRLAIPIRAYIADQPLRGRRPQPLSQLEELLFCFDAIRDLELNPYALASDPIAAGRVGERAHLHFLLPLLIRALSTASDKWSGAEEVMGPLQGVLAEVARYLA